jgi:flagellar basal-body rod modification protein FlgD
MAIDPIVTNPGQATGDRTRLSDNYDTFLVLLTAQLQNQDPLAPMDSTQFTQQLVQFSQVEQQIRTNEQLEGLVSQYQAASAGAALSYLGRDALIESGATRLAGGQATWGYSLGDTAEEAKITIKDSRGRTVFEGPAETTEGSHIFTWNGKNTAGETMPDGTYTMSVSAKDEAGESVDVVMTVRETIMGVDFSGATPLVITATGSRELSTIRAVMDGS